MLAHFLSIARIYHKETTKAKVRKTMHKDIEKLRDDITDIGLECCNVKDALVESRRALDPI